MVEGVIFGTGTKVVDPATGDPVVHLDTTGLSTVLTIESAKLLNELSAAKCRALLVGEFLE